MKLRYYLILFSVLVCSSNLNAQTVSISSSAPSNTICSGTNITFTANISGFTNPYYQWYANGTAISGATSSTYSSTSLVNGDQVNVKVNEGPFGGEITSNGLLLNLDATVQSSYSGSGTTWNNIAPLGNTVVSNFQLTSTNAAYSTDYGGVIRFSSAGGWASSSTGFPNLSSYTVEVWVRPVGTRGDQDPTISANYTPCFFAEIKSASTANKINMVLAYNARGLTTGTANNSYRYEAAINNGSGWKKYQIATNYSSDLNNWVQILSVYNGSTVTIYRNGVSLGTSSALGVASLSQTSAGYYIGHRWDQTDGVYGDYSKVMMYNKALTTTEVTANYNAFNARFVSSGVSSSSITITINPTTVPTITVNGDGCINKTSLTTTSGLTSYVWYKDNVIISGITTNALIPNAIGDYKVVVTNGSCSNTSSATTIYNCGINADGKAVSIANTGSLISREGGAYLGTAKDLTGKMFNTTSLTTIGASSVGTTSVVLGGIISGTNGRSSGIGVVYSTDPNFGSFLTTSISTNVAAGTYTSTISGLASSTKYYAKSFIVNASGTNYGSVVDFTTTTPTIVTNGLILYLNANSYSSGNTWSDLSTQNNNATLVGSPTFSSNPNSFTLASNKYALTSNLISSLSSATFIAWVNPSETQADYTGIIFSRGPNSGASAPATGMNFFRNNSVGYSWNDNGSTWGWDSRLQTPVNSWSMIAITISSNSATAYLCKASGITTAVNTVAHSALTGLKFYVGAEPFDINTRAMKGKISTAMIYSSALSLSDITSIFNAQKASFGL